jgi:ribosome-binding factor A
MSERADRVADQVRMALTRALREQVRDPRIGFVTVTGVKLSPDLRHAVVFVSMLEAGPARREALAGLEHAAPFLRRALARHSGLRFAPSLAFRFDSTLEDGARLEEMIRDWKSDGESGGESS